MEKVRYAKRDALVDAVEITAENAVEVAEWCGCTAWTATDGTIRVEGTALYPREAFVGYFVLRSVVDKEFHVMMPQNFYRAYDRVSA